jgi:hypothetical protein
MVINTLVAVKLPNYDTGAIDLKYSTCYYFGCSLEFMILFMYVNDFVLYVNWSSDWKSSPSHPIFRKEALKIYVILGNRDLYELNKF